MMDMASRIKMQRNQHTNEPIRQRGSTLVVSMVLLMLILLMGISAMVASDTQLKLSGNLQFEDTAFNNAEAGIATAESTLIKAGYCTSPGFRSDTHSADTPEQYPINAMVLPMTMDWNDTSSRMVTDDSQRYTIQLISKNIVSDASGLGMGGRSSAPPHAVNTYLITARGTGVRGSVKFLQSYFKVSTPC